MTTMALTSAPLRRLFPRLDFAPRPNEPRLASALEVWNELRLRRFAPQAPLSSLVPLGSGAALSSDQTGSATIFLNAQHPSLQTYWGA